jgi:hypothetical protein
MPAEKKPAKPAEKPSFLRKHTSAVVLSTLALGFGGYVLYDSDSLTTKEVDERKNQLMPAWRLDDVSKLEVSFDDVSYTLSRAEGEQPSRPWSMSHNGQTLPAEEQTVDKLLTVFQFARVIRKLEGAAIDREKLGLNAPSATFSFAMGKLNYKVKLGASAGADGVYAEVEGSGVYVIPSATALAMKVQPAELRSRAFVPYFSVDLSELHLEGEGGKRKFERAPWNGGRGSGFRFAKDSEGRPGSRVDGGRLDQVLVSLGKMQAETFLDEATAKTASAPRVTITMVPKQGEPGILKVGGACPGKPGLMVVVREKPTWLTACVPEGILDPLLREAAEFEDDGVIGAVVDEVIELSIVRGDKTLEMARLGTGFKVRKPTEMDIEAEVGNELLRDIQNARGKLVAADTPLAEPITIVKVRSGASERSTASPDRLEELEVGAVVDQQVIVLRKEDGQKVALEASVAAALEPSDLVLRDLTIFGIAPINLDQLTLERSNKRQILERNGAGFSLKEPSGKGLSADEPYALEAFNALATLRASRWVAAEPSPIHGFDKPRVVVKGRVSENEGSSRTIELLLGARSDEGIYAMATGTNAGLAGAQNQESGVFLLPFEKAASFSRNFVSRESFTIDLSTADEVVLDSAGKKSVLARAGRQLRLKDGSEAMSASIERAVVELVAIRAVGVGPAPTSLGFDKPVLEITVTPRKGSASDSTSGRFTVLLGGADTIEGNSVVYARRDDVDATFIVTEPAYQRLRAALRGEEVEAP